MSESTIAGLALVVTVGGAFAWIAWEASHRDYTAAKKYYNQLEKSYWKKRRRP